MNKIAASLFSCAVATTLVASGASASLGDLYVSGSGSITRYTPASIATPAAIGFTLPQGIAFDGNGNFFVADAAAGAIYKITRSGLKLVFVDGLGPVSGLAFDNDGNLFAALPVTGEIIRMDASGTKTVFASGLRNPAALTFDSLGNLYEADSGSDNVYKFTRAGFRTIYAAWFSSPNGAFGLAFDNTGNLFVSDTKAGEIIKVTPTGTRTVFTSGLIAPRGIAFDLDGNLFVVGGGTEGAGSSIVVIAPNGAKTVFASGSFDFIAFEPVAHHLLNISTRAFVQSNDRALIAGFIVGGNAAVGTSVVVRALGSSLTALGVPDALQDPTLEIHDASGALLARNDDWRTRQQAAQIQARGLAPADPHEAAIVATLRSGAYTAIVRGYDNTSGNALVEVYNQQ